MPYKLQKARGKDLYYVKNLETGKRYSKKPLPKDVAERQMRALYRAMSDEMTGEGIGDFFRGAYQRVKDVLKGKRDDYNPSSRKSLANYGNDPIKRMWVRRDPIQSILHKVLDAVTLGKWTEGRKKDVTFDQVYHLGIEVEVSHGGKTKRLVVEKNAVINISPANAWTDDTEVLEVPLPAGEQLTLNGLLENAKKYMKGDYFMYDAFKNNCQDYIMSILDANHLTTPELRAFVKQDLDNLVKELPEYTGAVAKAVTDIGALADVAMQGRGRRYDWDEAFSDMIKIIASHKDTLTATELRAVAARLDALRARAHRKLSAAARKKLAAECREFIEPFIVKKKILKRGAGASHGSRFWLDPRATIPALADAINSCTSPEEVRDILIQLTIPPKAPPRRRANQPRQYARYDKDATLHNFYVDMEEPTFETVDNIKAMLAAERDACMEMLDAARSEDQGRMMNAIGTAMAAVGTIQTLKGMANPTGILELGVNTLDHIVNAINGDLNFDPRANTSYSMGQEVANMMRVYLGPAGALFADLAASFTDLLGIKSQAAKNDPAVESMIQTKYNFMAKMIDDFKADWLLKKEQTGKQEEFIANQVDAKRTEQELYMRYKSALHPFATMTDAEWAVQYPGEARAMPYVSFDEWKARDGIM